MLQGIQNIINLSERKKEIEQEAETLKKLDDEISARIKAENKSYQNRLESAGDKYKQKVSDSNENSRRAYLKELSSQIPQLPLSSIQENEGLKATLDLLTPTDCFFQETKITFGKKPALFPDWSIKTFLWGLVSLLICAGLTAYAYAANLPVDEGPLAWLVYVLCAGPTIIWLVVVIVKCVKDGNWGRRALPKLSESAKEKIKAMETEEEYESRI